MDIPVGQIYLTAVNFITCSQGNLRNAPQRSRLFKEAISAQRIVFYFKEIDSDNIERDQQD